MRHSAESPAATLVPCAVWVVAQLSATVTVRVVIRLPPNPARTFKCVLARGRALGKHRLLHVRTSLLCTPTEGLFVAAFTQREVDYLRSQPLMRFASASPTGRPDVAAVAFEVDGDDIVTAGFDITKTVRYRNIEANPRAAVVIDDLAAVEPWTPRGIKVRGRVRIEGDSSGQRFRITPEVIWSWGVNDPGPGIPTMERREIAS